MVIPATTVGVAAATFLAAAVEFVEAFTIVLAMGVTRSWRAAILGAVAALLTLTAVTAVAGVTLINLVSESLLQLVIGSLLLIFGVQWLGKAVLRSAGVLAEHDEDQVLLRQREAASTAGSEVRLGLDWFAFVVAFKGVFLEGIEVVFIVVTFGLAASKKDPYGMLVAAALGLRHLLDRGRPGIFHPWRQPRVAGGRLGYSGASCRLADPLPNRRSGRRSRGMG
jgi:uncharacterized membrane protein